MTEVCFDIISISKLLGNYNRIANNFRQFSIISISKLLGNYNRLRALQVRAFIISISKLLGNYNYSTEQIQIDALYQYLNC